MEFQSKDIKMLEKALAIRQAKLYFRKNGKSLATPSQAEAENHVDFLADGKGVHVVAYSSSGAGFSDAFLHSEMLEVSPVANLEIKRPEVLAVVRLLSSSCEVEIHEMSDARKLLCDKEDAIMKKVVSNFEAKGNLFLDSSLLSQMVAEWYQLRGHDFRFPTEEEAANYVHIWLEDVTGEKKRDGELLPFHIIYEKQGKWWMIQNNIEYFKEKAQKRPPLYPELAVPEVICFLSSSEFHDGGIAMRFADVSGFNKIF